MAEGEEGATRPGRPGNREVLTGEAGRALFGAGDTDRNVAGDAERASFDVPAIEGLPGRGIPPAREVVEGEPGRRMFACKRVI